MYTKTTEILGYVKKLQFNDNDVYDRKKYLGIGQGFCVNKITNGSTFAGNVNGGSNLANAFLSSVNSCKLILWNQRGTRKDRKKLKKRITIFG